MTSPRRRRAKQRSGLDDTPARDVHEHAPRAEQLELGRAEHADGAWRLGHQDKDDVAGEDLGERADRDTERLGDLHRDERVVGQGVDAERAKQLDEAPCDVSEPDHPDALARQLGAVEARPRALGGRHVGRLVRDRPPE